MNTVSLSCELCSQAGGLVLWQDESCRIVRIADPHYPGFCRVIWHEHVREMSDLDESQQMQLMRVVFAVESVVRELFSPDKINLASFGNVVPHLHWHIIPRWNNDRHFPEPVWGSVQRESSHVERPAISNEVLATALATVLSGSI